MIEARVFQVVHDHGAVTFAAIAAGVPFLTLSVRSALVRLRRKGLVQRVRGRYCIIVGASAPHDDRGHRCR